MTCKNCGKEVPDRTIFCPNCGGRVMEPKDDKIGGIDETLLAVIAYLLALTGSTVPLILLLVFIGFFEAAKDLDNVWLSKHCVQALVFCIIPDIVATFLNSFNVLAYLSWNNINLVIALMISVIVAIINAMCIVCCVICIVTIRKDEFQFPVIGKLIDRFI